MRDKKLIVNLDAIAAILPPPPELTPEELDERERIYDQWESETKENHP